MMHSLKIIRKAVNGYKMLPFTATRIIARNSSVTTWNKDWKPGPYPKTPEEKMAAAKKYNMIIEDYEPYPEEEGYGDYPMFKRFHNESRNPHEPYDYWCLKRNFGEPVHPDFDVFQEDKPNFHLKMKYSLTKQFFMLMGGLSFFWALLLYDEFHPANQQRVAKQFPLDGITYYTFEANE